MEKILTLDSVGNIEEKVLSPDLIGDVVLNTPLTDLSQTPSIGSLSDLDTILQAFAKLKAQVLSKDTILHIEYLTGTTVLSEAQNAAIIDSVSDCNIFLPQGVNNLKYRLRNVGNGRVTFIPYGTDTIEKSTSYILLTENAFDLVFFNNNWFIF